ncbi:MAG: helix-turn-helix domain-containing protein [Massilioclostridium sp.]|nr:helix-turn-helix domain-containing protein [Massilioclostridium sp.]
MNCTPIVRQYGTLNNKRGALLCQKGSEAVTQDGLSDQEAARIYEIQGHDRIQNWVRIYLEEGPEGLAVERRGRGSKGRPKNCPKK